MRTDLKEPRRINYVSDDEDDLEDNEMMLQVDGKGIKPFLVEGVWQPI